jgi:hypothetical protein
VLGSAIARYRDGLPRGLPYDLRATADRLLGPDGEGGEETATLALAVAKAVFAQKNVQADDLLCEVQSLAGLRRLADVLVLARALTAEVTP